jgi:hypothetical protein
VARSYNRSNHSNRRNSGILILLIRYSGKVCVISPLVVTNVAKCRQYSVKYPIFFAHVHAVGAELLYADRRMEGRTDMTKQVFVLRNVFVNAPKNAAKMGHDTRPFCVLRNVNFAL